MLPESIAMANDFKREQPMIHAVQRSLHAGLQLPENFVEFAKNQ
jgi:hypothetical protein